MFTRVISVATVITVHVTVTHESPSYEYVTKDPGYLTQGLPIAHSHSTKCDISHQRVVLNLYLPGLVSQGFCD
jgi:hypothetical protein